MNTSSTNTVVAGASPERVTVKDFTIYRDSGEITCFESSGDLTVCLEGRDYDDMRQPDAGKVAVILSVGGDPINEVLVDDDESALTQLDRAIFHLTAARDQLAAMLVADVA